MTKPIIRNNKIVSWVFNFAILITVVFHSKIQDPFNSPKFWVLLLSASALLGHLLINKNDLSNNNKKTFNQFSAIISVYIVLLIISSIFSYNKNISFLGESFRRNGALTYIAFAIFFLTAAKFIRYENIKIALNKIIIIGILTSLYAFIQISGNDFVEWTNQSAVITTLGNSNFAGASMAIFLVLIFGQIFLKFLPLYRRIFALIVSCMLFVAILPTNARQALIILFFGIFLILLNQIFDVNKKIGYLVSIVGISSAVMALLGTLQIGPLSTLLYKPSVSVRGFYWRAGVEMFKDFPLFGVGIDNYGAFFKQYREAQYPLNYGFDITSSAAHNVFIQNFATGGIFLGSLYLYLQLFVAFKGINLVRKNNGDDRLIAIIIFVGWLSFQAQSLISIDNIGISIWGWILGGSIIGLSCDKSSEADSFVKPKSKSIIINWPRTLISSGAVMLSLMLILPLYQGEKYTWLARGYFNPSSTDIKIQEMFIKYSYQSLQSNFITTDYKNITLSNLYSFEPNKTVEFLDQVNKGDFRNLDTLGLLAAANELSGNLTRAIFYRKEIAKYDPWNAPNYLSLGLIYKKLNDETNMKLMLGKIQSFAASDPIADQALEQLVSTSG
jgi:O-antigen ligase